MLKHLVDTLFLRFYGLFKIPLIFYLSPTVMEFTKTRCVIRIPLNYRSKNHLGAMYFGALSAGADIAAGYAILRFIESTGNKISMVFKDFQAAFLKRAEGDTYFTCHSVEAVEKFVKQALQTTERIEMPIDIIATVPSKLGEEPVAKFTLTVSLKQRS